METKEWLTRYGPLYRETAALMKRLKVLEESECIVDSVEPEEIEKRCEKNLKEMAAIRAAIGMLDNPMEREVLRLRYTDITNAFPPKWKDVAQELYGVDDSNSIQNATRLRDRAINHIEQLLAEQNKASHPAGKLACNHL